MPLTRPPHILIITCHDLGRHLGCYGVATVQTPHLDGLAATGVRCSQAFATSSGCSPSRAALATGRYPHTNGVMGLVHPPFNWNLAPRERHVAEILGEAGYDTHLFGFQHVSTHVERLGFNHIHGYDRVLGCHEKALGSKVSARVVELLRGPLSGSPLYLEINLEEPHRPYDQGGAMPDDKKGVYVPGYLPEGPPAREEMAMLQGAIRQADQAVGAMLAAVDDAGLRQNALVIFTADHGLAMPRAKCTLYDPGLEVALIVRWPEGGLAGGHVRSGLLSNVDVLPTLLQAIDLPAPEELQGRSFLPLLRGNPSGGRSEIYAEKTFHSYYDPIRAIRTDRFKYIRNFEATFLVEVPGDVQMGAIFRTHVERYHGSEHPPLELYDLADDPLEQHNLANDPDMAENQRELDARLWKWMEQTGDPLLDGAIASPAHRSALEAGRATLDR